VGKKRDLLLVLKNLNWRLAYLKTKNEENIVKYISDYRRGLDL
jgi:hypothetical protein